MLNKQNLIKYFENGIKSNANLKIGTETEGGSYFLSAITKSKSRSVLAFGFNICTANKEQSGSGKILGFKNGSSISR